MDVPLAKSFERVLVSGASGAIGTFFFPDICKRWPDAEIVCLFRGERSLDRLVHSLSSSDRTRIRPVFAELTSADDIGNAKDALERVDRCLAIHCAGEVSWTKDETLVAPVNVEGTRHFADLAISTTASQPSFIFLSTAFAPDDGGYRNAYEKSKIHAEQILLHDLGAALKLAIIRCSLVVGSSANGYMPRFHGIYPLIRMVALSELPCLIADRDYKLDTVPVDYLSQEVMACANTLPDSSVCRLVIAACGDRSLLLTEFVQRTLSRANTFRAKYGLTALPEVSVITNRQFKFLMKASKSWGMGRRFQRIEEISRVLSGYIVHGESGRAMRPVGCTKEAPDPHSYIDTVIDYWLETNRHKVLANRHSRWLNDQGPTK